MWTVYEICRHIKKTAKLKHAKVVFMSAKSKKLIYKRDTT